MSADTLDQYDTVILGDMPLTDAQVTMFTDWVNGGGNLIAMSPDPKLAGLLGLTNASGTPLSEGYLKVDTASAPGKGIVGETIQFHGAADRYALGEARAVATLYSDANTATQNPAVTMRDVGDKRRSGCGFHLRPCEVRGLHSPGQPGLGWRRARRGGPGERVGISSMRERVAQLGGEFEVRSKRGEGTTVVAEIPLRMAGEEGEHGG